MEQLAIKQDKWICSLPPAEEMVANMQMDHWESENHYAQTGYLFAWID